MKRSLTTLRILVFAALFGCGQKPETNISPEPDQVWVRIINHHWSDVNVYAIDPKSGQKIRIESNLPFGGTRKVKLPRSFYSNSEVIFQIHLVGGRSEYVCHESPIRFSRGGTIKLEIKNYLPLSSCSLEPKFDNPER